MSPGEELELRPTSLLPMSVTDARDTMAVYQQICESVLTADDWQQAGEGKSFVTRSGFQKLSTAYGLSTEIVSLDVDRDEDGDPVRAHAVVRATHRTGRYAEGDGACERSERGRRRSDKPEHDLRATATTRATNRAVSNLIAFGQMSAEEVQTETPAPASTSAAEVPWHAGAAEGTELMDAAQAMVRIVSAFGDDEPAAAVRALGAAIRAECGGVIPLGVARTVIHLADLIPEPDPEPVDDAHVVPDPPESTPAGTEGSTPSPKTSDTTNAGESA